MLLTRPKGRDGKIGIVLSWRFIMKVAVGQCFVKADVPYPDVWQVVGIHQPPGFLAHVRLVRVENPGDSKTVSLVTLGDRRHYRPHDANRVVRRRLINSPRANPLQEA
jgi:hypothetical protein